MLIFEFSDSFLTILTNSFLLSSVRGGILTIIVSPLFIGLKPRFALIIPFSISCKILLSQGCTIKDFESGVFIFANWPIAVGFP